MDFCSNRPGPAEGSTAAAQTLTASAGMRSSKYCNVLVACGGKELNVQNKLKNGALLDSLASQTFCMDFPNITKYQTHTRPIKKLQVH